MIHTKNVVDATTLTGPISGEDYMDVLITRQATYTATLPKSGPLPRFPALLEWFVRDEDAEHVLLPEPAPKRVPTPRVYRTAASIREELDKVDDQLRTIADNGPSDPASVNLSPFARSRSAARAGRIRFARMDRDLARYTKLSQRRDRLAGCLASAEAREGRSGS